MASLLSIHIPFEVVKTTDNTTELTNTEQEAAGQTFLKGVPVQLNAGNVQQWDGVTIASGILGVSLEDAHNLATAGAGAPSAFTPVGFPGTGVTFGSVPNQPSAVNIPAGAPFSKGMVTYAEAVVNTIFRGQTDNSTGAGTTPTSASIGKQYGISFDANNHAYIDFAKATPGVNTVVIIYDLDPIDGSIANARILFKFIKAAMQLSV
jgi:hypothetical protein